ncbi:DAK2 domain-containing protein [Anaerolineae bacterium CFX9]|nr:DAK2 domain-containing protein [Anaerolineae bacterium CFX9]
MSTMITRQVFRDNANLVVDGFLIKQLFGAGLIWLEHNKERVNRLNVFPVPDGDTGTNMYLTMRNAYKEIAGMEESHVGKLSSAIARGALKGARGNSGVILSQLFAGTASVLEQHDRLTAPLFAESLREAVNYAYRAVEKPVEGTILTVAREMMESVTERQERDQDLVLLLKRMLFAGRAALRKTPDMLPLLKKAGVVDSGGAGLIYIFEGMLRSLCGKELTPAEMNAVTDVAEPAVVSESVETWQDALVPEDELGYGYDVQFLMRGSNLNIDEVRAAIQAMGWSTLVVGDNSLIKVHVHVHNPGEPLSYAINYGASLDDIVVENMQAQYEQYVDNRAGREAEIRTDIVGPAPIVVASGDGLKQLFMEAGAAFVIAGGQTMNPSTGDFLDVINLLPNEEIILLPNNKNVLLAAQQAAREAEANGRRVRVVSSTTVPQGIVAMVEYANQMLEETPPPLDVIVDAMTHALPHVQTCEITNATRDVELDGLTVRAGQYIGLLNDTLVTSADDLATATAQLLRRANADKYELITFYYGSDTSQHEAEMLAASLSEEFSAQEIRVLPGGQALYPFIISVE